MPRSVLRQSVAAAAIVTALVASLGQLNPPLAAARDSADRGKPVPQARSSTVKLSQLAAVPPTGDTPIKMSKPRNYPVDQNRYRDLKQHVDAEATQRENQQGRQKDDDTLPTSPSTQFATLNSGITGGWNPPDGALGMGPTSLLSGANEAFAIYSRGGALLVGPISFQTFFKEASTTSVYDPRALYDAGNATNGYAGGHGRFVLLATDGTNFTLGISQNESPENTATLWCIYQIPATSLNANGSTDWVDYPTLGMDGNNLYLTSNQFSNVDNSFQYPRLMVVPKAAVYPDSTTGTCGSGAGAVDFTIDATGAPLLQNPGGGASFTVQSANQPDAVPSTTASPTPMYLVNSIWSSGSNIVVRTVTTGPGGTSPVLNAPNWVTSGFIAPYSLPASAPQPSGAAIDTGDDRLLGATFRYGSIFTANTTGTVSGSLSAFPNPYANAQWYQITPTSETTSTGRSAAVTNSSVAFFFPSILPVCSTGPSCSTSTSKVVLEVSASGRRQAASAAWAANGNVAIFAGGVRGYTQYSRWGDYSAVAADATAPGTAWLFGEYARTTGSWGTAVTSITP